MSGECCLSSNQVRPTRPAGSHPNFQISNQATRRNPKQPCTAGMSGSPLTAMRVRDLSLRLVAIRPRHHFHAREAFPQNALMEKRKLHFMSLNLSYSFTSKFHKFQPVPQDRGSLDIHRRVKHPVPKSLFRGVVETKLVFFIIWNLWKKKSRRVFNSKNLQSHNVFSIIKEEVLLRSIACDQPAVE